MRQIIEIEPAWLVELAPHYYNSSEVEVERKMKNVGRSRMDSYN